MHGPATDTLGALDRLMPMHLRLCRAGRVAHVGPTLGRLKRPGDILNASFDDVFEIRSGASSAIGASSGVRKMQVTFRDPPRTGFKALQVPLPDGGSLVNLSFGISLVDAIRDHDLSSGDFAHTDLAIEMLYLVEAKNTVLEEWRKLNRRLESARIAAEEQAFTDTLTGLKNRRALDHVLTRLCDARAVFGLIHLDLDYFKQVNDTLGHAAGDHVLQVAARAMVEATRADDTLVRAGGDEFVIVLPGLVDRGKLVDLATRLIRRLEVPVPYGDDHCRISGSAGVAMAHGAADQTAEGLLEQADRALYASKKAGRARVTVFSPDLPPLAAA